MLPVLLRYWFWARLILAIPPRKLLRYWFWTLLLSARQYRPVRLIIGLPMFIIFLVKGCHVFWRAARRARWREMDRLDRLRAPDRYRGKA